MGPLSCHRNIIVTLIIKEFGSVSLIAVFLKKNLTGFNQNDYCSMLCLLEVSLSTLTNVKALKKHKLNST